MKKTFFLMMALIPVCLCAQQRVMELTPTAGSVSTYALSDISKQTFESGKLITSFNNAEADVESTLTELSKVTFGTGETGLAQQTATTDYRLYPMPVQEDLHLSFEAPTAANAVLQVLTLDGRIVLSSTQTVVGGANALIINVDALSQGVYLCRLSYAGEHYVQQIIKQ